MEEKIWIILPYEELYEIAKQCKKERNLNVKIKKGNLEEAIPIALEAQNSGAEVIISRGGTATFIRNHVNIPVVEIKVTYFDLLKMLYPYRDSEKILLIVGYENVVYGCKSLSNFLNIKIKELIIPPEENEQRWDEISSEAEDLINKYNIDTIIGDTVSISKLGPLCKYAHLIASGKEAIYFTMEEARNIISAKTYQKENTKKFQAILDFINDGVVAVDERGHITAFNPSAEKMFKVKRENVIGTHVDNVVGCQYVSETLETKTAKLEQLHNSPEGSIMSNHIPINVEGQMKGVVSTFQETSKIQGAEQKIRENMYSKVFVTRYTFNDILTKNIRMKKIIEMAKDYSKTHATILIEGNSGTGKEVFAQSIHANSSRGRGPFIAVNCAALPPQLLESELFGYVEGAFTGAAKGGKIGLFEMAHNGTIFLDEIGDVDKGLQARFLRVLEEKQVMRLGSDKIVPVNIRVIAATNVNLREQVAKGNFRSDLYYRLNVLNLHLLPLSDRTSDIEYLSNYFIRQSNKKHGLQVEKLSDEVIEFLKSYSWPGNLRELKNVIERIVLTTKKDYVTLKDIELIVEELKLNDEPHKTFGETEELLSGTLQEIKTRIINTVLKEEGYNKSKTARRLGIDRSTLERFI